MWYLHRLPAAVLVVGTITSLIAGQAAATDTRVAVGELQAALARAVPGEVLRLAPGIHRGGLVITQSVTLTGQPGAVIDGGGSGSVLTVDAPGVHIENLVITGSGLRLSTEDSGIFITDKGDGAIVNGNTLADNLIGVFLKGPDAAIVMDNRIEGRRDLRVNERGNGVQLWNTPGSVVEGNSIRYGRDGIFVTTSRDNLFRNNEFSDLRFAVHYMYTNDSAVIGNISRGNKVGYALMYSSRLEVRDNLSEGDIDRGVFFNFANDSNISDNTVEPARQGAGPEKCVFVYNSNYNTVHGNHFEACQIGIHFTAGSEQNTIWENSFIGNRNQVKYVGTRELEWSRDGRGNYWSDHVSFDLDGDGLANQPYRPNSVTDQILWRYPLARFLMNSPVLQILAWAQSEFPALYPGGVTDSFPLMQPPDRESPG